MLPRVVLPLALVLAAALPATAQQVTLPLWPAGTPEPAHTTGPERDVTTDKDNVVAGRRAIRYADVSVPTLAFYPAAASHNTGAAAIVFPGGGYVRLAYDLEGTEVADWLNSIGVSAIVVKYRVPEKGHFPANVEDMEDAQQAMRLTRAHAAEWHLDPHRLGVIGFSAGAHLAVALSNNPTFSRSDLPEAAAKQINSQIDARPDFAMVIYPGYLTEDAAHNTLSEGTAPTANTPPTFLLQAEDDPVHVENCLIYYRALKDAKVPAEIHLFAEGGHGYGLRPTGRPIAHWPALAATWLQTIHMLGSESPTHP